MRRNSFQSEAGSQAGKVLVILKKERNRANLKSPLTPLKRDNPVNSGKPKFQGKEKAGE
jgi:hypothetical protein